MDKDSKARFALYLGLKPDASRSEMLAALRRQTNAAGTVGDLKDALLVLPGVRGVNVVTCTQDPAMDRHQVRVCVRVSWWRKHFPTLLFRKFWRQVAEALAETLPASVMTLGSWERSADRFGFDLPIRFDVLN